MSMHKCMGGASSGPVFPIDTVLVATETAIEHAINSARYEKLRALHCDGQVKSMFHTREGRRMSITIDGPGPQDFDSSVDQLVLPEDIAGPTFNASTYRGRRA